ncbi:glycosyltransferase [Pseudonocardia hydrocarbonoxydans]|uniref:glycosyltransferase n=1 Tax=Pseudonocardia hydrocarbonoxydans TaxID=76726 RepID=UPI0031D4E31F
MIVCCFTDRRRAEILVAIASVRAQTVPPDEVVVVVDHNPGLLAWLRDELAGVVLVPNTGSRGLTGARNTGVERSGSDIVVFLDDDAAAEPTWLADLLSEYADPDVVAVGGRIDPDWAGTKPPWFPAEFGWVVGCSYTGQPRDRAVVRNVIGANMSFRRQVVREVGGFRQELGRIGTLPAGCEETELCIRATARTGGQVVYQPRAVVSHRVSPDRGRWSYFRSRCLAEGRSKAVVARLAGSDQALSTERSYVTRVLPVGVLRALRAGVAGDPGGFGRAAAIVAGLVLTVTGYVGGRAGRRWPAAPVSTVPPQPPAAPGPGIWCGQMELSGGDGFSAAAPHRPGQSTARVLVRLHGRPLGYLSVPAPDGRLDADDLRRRAWETYRDRITEHLGGDGHDVGPADRGAPPPLPGPTHTCTDRLEPVETVSVVVCTRQRSDILAGCLASLRDLTYPRLEVIVVDNAPVDDATRDLVRRVQELDARFHYVVERRPGLSCARNAGLAHATGSIVAYTDDDVVVDPRWVEGIVRGFRTGSEVACVTGMVCSAGIDGQVEAYFDARAASWWNRCRTELFELRKPPLDSPLFPFTPAAFGTGANCAFDRTFLVGSGGFDEALGAGSRTRGGEDVDKFVDTLLRGRAIVYEPSAIVWHHHRSDRAGLLRQMFGYGSGLTAFVVKLLTRRATAVQVVTRIPLGVRRALGNRAATSRSLASVPVPRGAALVETIGMLAGPYLYAAARRGNHRQRAGRR